MSKALFLAALLSAAALASETVDPGAPALGTTSPCECAAKKRCWNVVMAIDSKMVGISEDEIEKALPGRYFPNTLTFVMRHPTGDGHFLIVQCGKARQPCADKRDELERRMILSDFLASLPLGLPKGTLFDPETMRITEAGEKTFSQVKQCRKGLVGELAAVVLRSGGE